MKAFIQTVSVLALVAGLAIALYSWQAQNIVNAQAAQQAQEQSRGQTFYAWSTPTVPVADRALGLAFGFGLSFLGAFGLYAQLRLPSSPTRPTLTP